MCRLPLPCDVRRDLAHWSLSNVYDDLTVVLPVECDYMPPQARHARSVP